MLDYGVREFGFDVLDAVTMAENTRSIRLLEKLGFSRIESLAPTDGSDDPLELYRWQQIG